MVVPGVGVYDHCCIVGEVAKELVKRLPANIRAHLFPDGSELVAAVHDIGKVSPYFYEKIRQNCTQPVVDLPVLKDINPDLESNWGGHAGVSQVALREIGAPEYVQRIAGKHHGSVPPVNGKRATDQVFGGKPWQEERGKLVTAIKNYFNSNWPVLKDDHFARTQVLAGLTTVADWIGSGDFFSDPLDDWPLKIKEAVDSAGFIPPVYKKGLSFSDIFHFSPWEIQKTLIDKIQGPGVYLLEAPMGIGKTEAALYSAYKMLTRGLASGIYFALPTQLTSNKIYSRFQEFLCNVLADDDRHRSLLLHSNAWLVDTEMGEDAAPGGSWFNSSKRGLLAPFAVGTLDQALMAAMRVKHGFVRAFGLAGKVVILDEVHTYDHYTGTILDALIDLLVHLRCTVIILTATLSYTRRKELIKTSINTDDYPLVTSLPLEGRISASSVKVTNEKRVRINLVSDKLHATEEALRRAARGEHVLWIENTVNDAQDTYLDLASRAAGMGVECGLLHSRYTAEDRQIKEDRWVELFGKDGRTRQVSSGRILVGTQVLEQSLDIDADFLVSRFAPSDMLLQRLGRLWRHESSVRPAEAACEACLLVPAEDSDICKKPYQAFGKSAAVYSPYVLCRSLEVWRDRTSVGLPQDIRKIIEETYRERSDEGDMARLYQEMVDGTRYRKGVRALRNLALLALDSDGKTLPESKAQTRYSEIESIEVLLLKQVVHDKAGKTTHLVLLNGDSIDLPCNSGRLSSRRRKLLAAKLMSQIVNVTPKHAPNPVSYDNLKKWGFGNCLYLGSPKEDDALLRVVLVNDSRALVGLDGSPASEKLDLSYHRDLGYRVKDKESNGESI
ncbi:MAG: CRISPR-associated helicase Cas3' [Candidatus Dadabacteria bacterium]|nr:MAG: CRISPR-associated helicase Cas3' [Candidatus Dadabacteria bacterium]